MKEYNFNIPGIFNIFSSEQLNDIMDNYNIKNYYSVKQVHSDIIHIVDNNYINNTIGDALITTKVNTPLLIKIADCIPVLIYDRENNVLALVHSGWKGLLQNITNKTVDTLINKFNSKPENLEVYIYPSIRKCHFCVKDDVYPQFKVNINNIEKYTEKKEDSYYIDIEQILIDNLIEKGITNIKDSNICTCEDTNEFHSYRLNKTDKRNYLIAYIKE